MTTQAPTHRHAQDTAVASGRFGVAMRLLTGRQRLSLVVLTSERIAVGLCDLSVAAAMYFLFLLLQGRSPAHAFRWIPKTTLSAAILTSILLALRVLMDLFSFESVIRYIERLHTDLMLRLAQGYSQMQWGRFVVCNRSELSSRALNTAREAAAFYHRVIELVAAVVIVLVMSGAIVYQSPISACGFAAALGGFFALHRFFMRKRLLSSAVGREESLRALQRNLADIFSSGKEIRTYRNYAFFHDRIRKQAKRMAASNLRITFLPQVASSLADQGAVLLFLCIIVVVQLRQGDARQVLSLLAFYFVLSRRLIPLISQISIIAGQFESSLESVRIVSEELNECRRFGEPVLPLRPPAAGFVLQMENVSFAFRDGFPILRNASLSLREGETVVLYGASGAGKSSLLNLIAGVAQPASGLVHVDRTKVAYVPQEAPLLDDSIRNNLLFGLPDRGDAELMQALAAANLDDFVAAQPFALETNVGDNGALFSGGQRQRLGLARAILRGSQLLLLDEATSALDENSERQVLENLSRSGKAILLVTHRVVLRTFAQRVFRLEAGHLFEELPQAAWRDEEVVAADL